MFAALLLSFGVIFVAELGDKSQLMAMTFALRYRWWVVLGGITAATTAVHLISVAVGHYLGAALPTHLIGILAGVAFVLFGLWTLRGDRLSADEATRAQRTTAPAFFAVMSAFMLAELGDKTMLATVTLAADNDWVGVWIGSIWAWSPPTRSPSWSGRSRASTFPSGSSSSPRPRCSWPSASACSSVASSRRRRSRWLVGSAVAVVVLFAVALRAMPERLRPAAMRTEPAPLTVSVEPGWDEVPDVGNARASTEQKE